MSPGWPSHLVWKDGYVVTYGTDICFRCHARLQVGERFKVTRYTAWPTPNRPVERVRIIHGEECPDGS